ncbi:unnamed protein product [Phytophthora fragariaefolia]|uniref:Unnamed protein product n=1 Tax=Phytophthora fragariaefolia TaxID=1490495 RepID=A0A9W7CNR9_9STRA|nr:unnamed protein product [Phytophthora fragariaefolia]
MKGRSAARQAALAAAKHSKPTPRDLPPPPASSAPMSSAPVSGIAVSADSDVHSFESVPSGYYPPFSPISRPPMSPASSTASAMSLPSTPVAPSGVTPGTEASVPVEIDDNGGAEASESRPLVRSHPCIFWAARRVLVNHRSR